MKMKRIISFLLTIVLIVSMPLAAYAEGSAGGIPVSPGNSGGGSNPTIPDSWGIKVSVSSVTPIIEAGVSPINGTSDAAAAREQYDAIVDINRTRMWDPGCWGINFINNPRTPARVISDPLNGKTDPGVVTNGIQNAALGADAAAQKNQLAWMLYLTGNPTSRKDETDYVTGASSEAGYSYSGELYELLIGDGASNAISTMGTSAWLESVKQLYLANGGNPDFDGYHTSQETVKRYNEGMLANESIIHLLSYIGERTNLPVSEYGIYKLGAPDQTASIVLDGVRYFTGFGECAAYGCEDAYVFALPGTIGITLGDEAEPVIGYVNSAWLEGWNIVTGEHIVYDTDGTRDAIFDAMARDGSLITKYLSADHVYYKCVNHQLVPITEEEAVGLGYVRKK